MGHIQHIKVQYNYIILSIMIENKEDSKGVVT